MKKIVLFVVCGLLLANVAGAQSKFGYINSAELLNVMPEIKKANTDIEAYQKSLQCRRKEHDRCSKGSKARRTDGHPEPPADYAAERRRKN